MSGKKQRRCDHPVNKRQRELIEAELSAIAPLDPKLAKLMSPEGFVDYYLRMVALYPSNRLAYERLEDFYISITGKRRYSEFYSFRKILNRYTNSYER